MSLGTVLPEERLGTAATWTGKALRLAPYIGDQPFLAHALRMHGNELRKAGRLRAAIRRLDHALAVSADPAGQGTALALLARATAEAHQPHAFHAAITRCQRLLDTGVEHGMLSNHFALREIHARGLLALNQPIQALHALHDNSTAEPAAPQWKIMGHITTGEALAVTGACTDAQSTLLAAIDAAGQRRLPHQLRRIIRAAHQTELTTIATAAHAALRQLAPP